MNNNNWKFKVLSGSDMKRNFHRQIIWDPVLLNYHVYENEQCDKMVTIIFVL